MAKVAVCSEIDTYYTYKYNLCGNNVEFFNVTRIGTESNRSA